MKRLIFTIYVNIPDEELDNPGHYSFDGKFISTDKSRQTKNLLSTYKDRLIDRQREYANAIGAEYKVFERDDLYESFVDWFKDNAPQISQYDIICFYKHHLMLLFADQYDQICYFDLDIVPNTTDSVFDAFDLTNSFVVPDSNKEAEWGKTVAPRLYNTCIRNPATKYWNAHAMLAHQGYEPNQHVYNTGIMLASSNVIKKLDYFGKFQETLELMTFLKQDPNSMYPKNIQRVFNYDNETIFSYKLIDNGIESMLMGNQWHHVIDRDETDPNAKLYHVINKKFWLLLT